MLSYRNMRKRSPLEMSTPAVYALVLGLILITNGWDQAHANPLETSSTSPDIPNVTLSERVTFVNDQGNVLQNVTIGYPQVHAKTITSSVNSAKIPHVNTSAPFTFINLMQCYKLDTLKNKLNGLTKLEKKMHAVEAKLNKLSEIDIKMNAVESTLGNVDSQLKDVTSKFTNLEEVHTKLKTIQRKLNSLSDDEKGIPALVSDVSEVESKLDLAIAPWKANDCESLRDLQIRPCIQPRHIVTWSDGKNVLCDTLTSGGGWTIVQRRFDGSVDFYRGWEEYVNGFGDPTGEFWLGLGPLQRLVETGDYELRIDMKYKGRAYYAVYSHFTLSHPSDIYRLSISGYLGTAGDSLAYQNGMAFSTFDRDNDMTNYTCAQKFSGAWWYKACHKSNLNGLWGSTVYGKGLNWYLITQYNDSVVFSEMKVRKRK